MNQILESIKQFISRFGSKKLLPSVIVRSGLPILYKQTIIFRKPKNGIARFAERVKNFFWR